MGFSSEMEASPHRVCRPAGVIHRSLPSVPFCQGLLDAHTNAKASDLLMIDAQPSFPAGGHICTSRTKERRTASANDDRAPPLAGNGWVPRVNHMMFGGSEDITYLRRRAAAWTVDVNMFEIFQCDTWCLCDCSVAFCVAW